MSIHDVLREDRRWPRRVLVVLAAGQVVSSTLSNLFGGAFTTADRPGEPPIVPVGWTFSIWGVIMLLSLGWALWAERVAPRAGRRSSEDDVSAQLARPLLVVFAGFSAWIAAAEIEPVWATLVVFVLMLAGLLAAGRIALAQHDAIRRWSPTGRLLLWTLLGLYTGWSSVAIWLNLTTALTTSGAPITGALGVAGQLAVLAAAVATAVALLVRARRAPVLALSGAGAVVWAFVGSSVGAATQGEPALAVAALVGTAIVVAAAVVSVVARPRSRGGRSRPATVHGAAETTPTARSAAPAVGETPTATS